MTPAYAGIDVAFAKKKTLPVVVCVWGGSRLVPLPLRRGEARPPRGEGNAAIVRRPESVAAFAEATEKYLRDVEIEHDVSIQVIAIDAPSAPRRDGLDTRECERGLAKAGISFIKTPCESDFEQLRSRALEHLSTSGDETRIKGANQLWMLVGFELFRRLSQSWKCIEVYPQAISHALSSASVHKSHADGLSAQLAALALRTGWPEHADPRALDLIGFGSRHDRLDAYLAAWVASLPETGRIQYGADGDAIWVPA